MVQKAFDICIIVLALLLGLSCNTFSSVTKEAPSKTDDKVTAKEIIGNPEIQAISYGGYRTNTRDIQPTISQLKEDLKILEALNIKLLRTYNTHFAHAANLLKAIRELKQENAEFEMYIMLGAWIDCKDAWTPNPNHDEENVEANTAEIERAIHLANEYKDIVKIIAVGNEAMVTWATSYYVKPAIILKWVNYLQKMKTQGDLPRDIWITSSDNFASWGGGDSSYHTEELTELIRAVDFVSLHTYPMHDTHYNPIFWGITDSESGKPKLEVISSSMDRALEYSKLQYRSTEKYINSLGIEKPIHIGETGWASASNGFYSNNGSRAADEYKAGLYYSLIREWTNKQNITCFYFEAFDEPWKDSNNPGGSENHFGLFTVDGKAKYSIWKAVDDGIFQGLSRGGNQITKTYEGSIERLLNQVKIPQVKEKMYLPE